MESKRSAVKKGFKTNEIRNLEEFKSFLVKEYHGDLVNSNFRSHRLDCNIHVLYRAYLACFQLPRGFDTKNLLREYDGLLANSMLNR